MFKKVQSDKQIEEVARLARTIWKDYFDSMIGSETVDCLLKKLQSRQAISRQIKEGYEYYLIQPAANQIGYFAVIHKKETDEMFLSKLYLLDSERGKGYGKTAMQFIEAMANEKNCRKISLTVFHKNEKAIRAYEKMGFRQTGSIMRDIGDHIIIHDYSMEKMLLERLTE